MAVKLVTDEKIAETSSKGNQEKWFDGEVWYKLDQFGYEALTEVISSSILARSNVEKNFPFRFVRYNMEKVSVRGRERVGCASENFLKPNQSLITINRLLSNHLGFPLKQKLSALTSTKRRIQYLADAVVEYTGLTKFPQYLTVLFELDSLICNDDRHLNNIAVIRSEQGYEYCPIFDNGAGLLSNTMLMRMDVEPKALASSLVASPLGISFNRQVSAVRGLFGRQLDIPRLSNSDISDILSAALEYYPERDRGIIADRTSYCLFSRQKQLFG